MLFTVLFVLASGVLGGAIAAKVAEFAGIGIVD